MTPKPRPSVDELERELLACRSALYRCYRVIREQADMMERLLAGDEKTISYFADEEG